VPQKAHSSETKQGKYISCLKTTQVRSLRSSSIQFRSVRFASYYQGLFRVIIQLEKVAFLNRKQAKLAHTQFALSHS